nr:flagellar motor switch protein FliM [Futiania mangrovii]
MGDGVGRILNQDEIDSLMGFDLDAGGDWSDEGAEDAAGGSGSLAAIVNSSLVSYERLPMLEIVFDRLVRLLTGSLRTLTAGSVEVDIESISSVRFGDYTEQVPVPTLMAVFKATEWDNHALFTLDSGLIYAVVDILLGGRRGGRAVDPDGRPFSTLERRLVERLVTATLDDLGQAFKPLADVHFTLDRTETNPRFAAIDRPSNACVLVRLKIDFEKRGGRMDLLLPHATLEPVREVLLQMFMGEKFGRDKIWESHLAGEVWRTEVEIEAVLDERTVPLGDLCRLKVGDTLMFGAMPDGEVVLRAGGVPLHTGTAGRTGSRASVTVVRALAGEAAAARGEDAA